MSEKTIRNKTDPLDICYDLSSGKFEVGVDEVGRGPLFGRVYTAAVILPKDSSFDHALMKDSKRFHSEKKICDAAQYIKENAIAWFVSYEDETVIDNINIRQATLKSMHNSIKGAIIKRDGTINTISDVDPTDYMLLIDGNDFKPVTYLHNDSLVGINHTCVEGGDNKYTAIAAASIIAKVARDEYIKELCSANPELIDRYNIGSNKGYGAAVHINGIKEHGISKWHRKTYGICKNY
jgi:ribonuclease HII